MEIALVIVGVVIALFWIYVALRLRDRRKPISPQVKGPTQRHMEDGHL